MRKLNPINVARRLAELVPLSVRDLLAPFSKGIASALSVLIVGYIAKLGFDVDAGDVELVILAALAGAGTGASPANRERARR